jgi:outer membrane lipoprotein
MRHAIASLHLPAWTMAVLMSLAALMGCASQVPVAIRTAPADAPDPAQVRQDPARFTGHPVRWGGTIIGVENRPDHTDIEVLAHPLDRDGEPRAGGPEQGRFIARAAGFLDPAEYARDRLLTVAGAVTGVETRPVGDYPYSYPVVRIEDRYLWPKAPPPGAYPDPGFPVWYDPWYGPWYGFGPWPGPWVGPWYAPPRPHPGPWRQPRPRH